MEKIIDQAFEDKIDLNTQECTDAILKTIALLDSGEISVVEKKSDNTWFVNQWVKKAILLYFRTQKMQTIENGPFSYVDKIPVKKWTGKEQVRVVPQAIVRYGAFIEPKAILMPSYVNIGARVGSGSMIDTWATVGSCAYVGQNVHVSGGVGLGGVLEPVQASPVIIEDNVFLGSRCIVVEGVHVEQGAVLGAGLTLTQSTKIIDVTGNEPKIFKGKIPADSVVIPGTQPKEFSAGTFGTPCALIIGKRKESTNKKTSLTAALREFEVPV